MKAIIYLIIGLIMINVVLGLGVGPAKTRIDFEPELSKEYSINVYNTDNENFTLILELNGELSKYLEIKSQTTIFNSQDEKKTIIFSVSFPKDIPPGEYNGKINLIQKKDNNKGTISASIGLVHNIYLNVPLHGKYILANIEEEPSNIVITIRNTGLKEINKLSINNTIIGGQERLETFDSINNFQSDMERRLVIRKPSQKGLYNNILNIEYDNLTKKFNKIFTVGEVLVDIKDFRINNFVLGNINLIEIPLYIDWNTNIRTRVEVEIHNSENQIINTIISSDYLFKGNKTAEVFWETNNYSDGDYNFKIRTYYEENISLEKSFNVKIQNSKLFIKEETGLKQIILIIIIIILLIVLFNVFLKIKK